MKETELDNMLSLLVAMKKNCELKMNMDNLFFTDTTLSQDIKSYCDIMQNNIQWIDSYDLNLYKNFNSAIEKYNTQINILKKRINEIEFILIDRYQSDIMNLFSGGNLLSDESQLVSLVLIDGFLKRVSMM